MLLLLAVRYLLYLLLDIMVHLVLLLPGSRKEQGVILGSSAEDASSGMLLCYLLSVLIVSLCFSPLLSPVTTLLLLGHPGIHKLIVVSAAEGFWGQPVPVAAGTLRCIWDQTALQVPYRY